MDVNIYLEISCESRKLVTYYHNIANFGYCKLVEAVATTCLVYLSGQISATLSTYNTPKAGAFAAVSNMALIATFIYATSPASGGHVNPMITFSAMFAGICPIPRGEYYIN